MSDSSAGPQLIVIPPGSFVMGSDSVDPARATEQPAHRVSLRQPIAVALFEVTVAQFEQFHADTGYLTVPGCWYHTAQQEWALDETATWLAPGYEQTDDYPVTCVNWQDATLYTRWLSEQTGQRYRLPSESEFEYFNRAGVTGAWPFGVLQSAGLCAVANGADGGTGLPYANSCVDGSAGVSPVGRYQANAYGLFDTSGNLWEFTRDCWRGHFGRHPKTLFTGPPVDGSAWILGGCKLHVQKGGSYLSSPDNLRLSSRQPGQGNLRLNRSGFRVVREL